MADELEQIEQRIRAKLDRRRHLNLPDVAKSRGTIGLKPQSISVSFAIAESWLAALRAAREAQQQADERYQVVCIGRDAIATRCAEAESALASVRAALRDLLDAIPDETLKADPPLEAWAQAAERALAASSAGETK